MKRYERICSLMLAMLLLLGVFVSCKSKPQKEQPFDTEPNTEIATEGETTDQSPKPETEQPNEPAPVLDLQAQTLSAESDQVLLSLSCEIFEQGLEGELCSRLTKGDQELAQGRTSLVAGEQQITLACAQDKLTGVLTLQVDAVLTDGTVADCLTLTMKNGVVQLSADAVACVVAAMTLEEKATLTSGAQNTRKRGCVGATAEFKKYGIPSIGFSDGPAGVRSDLKSSAIWYPSITNISSSWDSEIIYRVGEAIGLDGRAFGTDILLAPGMNIQKNAFGGRNFEYSSEDPLLTGYLMSAYVNGVQSTGIGAEIKHFAVNNQETSRVIYSANVTERALREIYLKGFGIAVRDSAPWVVMSSYNRINRNHNATERELLVGILRDEFGFDGMVTSDWGGVTGSIDAKINAMNDINMPGNAEDHGILVNAVKSGTVSIEALDECCRNILSVVVKTRTFLDAEKQSVDYEGHAALAQEAAENSFVLLKNQSALPLANGTTVALFGNGGWQTVYGGGGSGVVKAKSPVSIFDGIKDSGVFQLYDQSASPFLGCAAHDVNNASYDVSVTEAYAKQCAQNADAAVIVLSRQAIEGVDSTNRAGDFRLNQTEMDMLTRVSAAFRAEGKKVIVLINTGNPIETVSWRDLVDAVLYIGYPGEQAGNAVVNVLSGKVNPSGKLTCTWPASFESTPAYNYFPGGLHDVTYYEDIYVGYRYYETFGVQVAYEFGYGLSYTEFSYSDFACVQNADGSVSVTLLVTNTGKTAGREIVQCYVSKPETNLEQAKLELGGFAKTKLLSPGESETVRIKLTEDALKSYDEAQSAWILDVGTYTVSVGASVKDIKFTDSFTVGEKQVILDVENLCVPEVEFEYISKKTYTVPAPETRVNLASGAKITASDGDGSTAIDGDTCSLWNPGQNGASITLDLGSKKEIGEMTLSWYAIHTVYLIQLSNDGKNFTDYRCSADKGSGYTVINLNGTSARYIRIKIIRADNQGIYEWRVFEATEADKNTTNAYSGENLALGKPAKATNIEGGNLPSLAVDGNYSTRWSSLQYGDATFVLDLKKAYDVKALEMILESAWISYRIEYSLDGENYTTLFEGKKDELVVELAHLDIQARYIRVRRDGDGWFSIYELKIFG